MQRDGYLILLEAFADPSLKDEGICHAGLYVLSLTFDIPAFAKRKQ